VTVERVGEDDESLYERPVRRELVSIEEYALI
jgi:hypothetical protein